MRVPEIPAIAAKWGIYPALGGSITIRTLPRSGYAIAKVNTWGAVNTKTAVNVNWDAGILIDLYFRSYYTGRACKICPPCI